MLYVEFEMVWFTIKQERAKGESKPQLHSLVPSTGQGPDTEVLHMGNFNILT